MAAWAATPLLASPTPQVSRPAAPPTKAHRQQQLAAAAAAAAAAARPCKCTAAAAGERRRLRRRHSSLIAAALRVEAPSEAVAPETAWALLEEFTAKEARGLAQPLLNDRAFRRRLRDAVLAATAAPYVPAGWNPDASGSSGGDAESSAGSSAGSGGGSGVPEVLLGVLASDVRLAVRSLRDYCQALGLPFKMPESRVPGVAAAPAIAGPTYIKYNSASGLCYASQYEGRDRGVLLQLGQRQLGHLPLGMFDEGMARPPPGGLGGAGGGGAAASS